MAAKPGKPSLRDDQAARVAKLLEELFLKRFGENKTKLAEALGRTQSAVNQLLAGKNRASYQTAEAVARLMGKPVAWVLGDGAGARTYDLESMPAGLRELVASTPPGTYSDEEIARASTFRDRNGVDLTSARYAKLIALQRTLEANLRAEQELEAAGVTEKPSAKIDVEVVHRDPIEETKAQRKADRDRAKRKR